MSDLSLQHHLSHSQQLADTLHHLLHQHPDHTLPLVVVLADRDFIDAAPGRNQACRQRALHLAAQCQMAGGAVKCVLESLLPPQRGLAHQLQARHAGCASHASAAAQLAALQLTLGARHCHAPDELAEHVDQLLAGHPLPSQPLRVLRLSLEGVNVEPIADEAATLGRLLADSQALAAQMRRG